MIYTREFVLRQEPLLSEEDSILSGLAVPYNTPEEIAPGIIETIERGAFSESIARDEINFSLFHNEEFILAKNNNALKLEEREDGVWYEITLPDSFLSHHLVSLVKNRTLSGVSVAMFIEDAEIEEPVDQDQPIRATVIKATLRHLGPVVTPAYPTTSISLSELRSYYGIEQESKFYYYRTRMAQLRQISNILDFHRRNLGR